MTTVTSSGAKTISFIKGRSSFASPLLCTLTFWQREHPSPYGRSDIFVVALATADNDDSEQTIVTECVPCDAHALKALTHIEYLVDKDDPDGAWRAVATLLAEQAPEVFYVNTLSGPHGKLDYLEMHVPLSPQLSFFIRHH